MDSGVSLLLHGLLAMLLVVPVIGPAYRITKGLLLPNVLVYGVVLLLLGGAAEMTFFLTLWSTIAANIFVWSCALAGAVLTIRTVRDPIARRALSDPDCSIPFALVSIGAICLMTAFGLAQPPGESSTTFGSHSLLNLPIDNVLPEMLAQHVAAHAPPKPFAGEWLSSDRPPLQAGFDLMYGAIVPNGIHDTPYQSLAMLLQLTSLGAFFILCRLSGCSARRAVGVTALTALTGFIFLNSVFVWPKLLSAALMIIGVAIYLAPGERTRLRSIAWGGAIGLALMAHGGVAFSVPALLMVAIVQNRQRLANTVVVAGCMVAIVLGPWVFYQKVIDPPGDRLLKWHLAGQVAMTTTSFLPTLEHAYVDTPISTIVLDKLANFKIVFGSTPGPMDARGREFFYVGDALGVLGYVFLASLAFFASRRPALRFGASFGWIAVGSLIFWCLAMYIPGSTVVHQGSDTTELFMFLSAGLLASESLPIFIVIFAWQLVHFLFVWTPLKTAVPLASGNVFGWALPAAVAIAVALIWLRRKRQFDWNATHSESNDSAVAVQPLRRPVRIAVIAAAGFFIVAAIVVRSPLVKDRDVTAQAAAPPAAVPASRPLPGVNYAIDLVSFGKSSVLVGDASRPLCVVGTQAIVEGWALDPRTLGPTHAVQAQLDDGAQRAVSTYGIARPDVANVLRNSKAAHSGFRANFSLAHVHPGIHVVQFFVVTPARESLKLPTEIRLDVTRGKNCSVLATR